MLSMPSALLLFNFCMANSVSCFVGECIPFSPLFVFGSVLCLVLLLHFYVNFCLLSHQSAPSISLNLFLVTSCVPFCVFTQICMRFVSFFYLFLPFCMPVGGWFLKFLFFCS
jgi:hypothetical protein